ncbi:MAG: FHA domain-containing protein, partial [Rhodocyclaceae bacterium]
MITIRVISFHGQPPAQPLVFDFDETGGTIGRATTNQLVLPDPDRHISRVQATVLFRGGQYFLLDQGSANPVLVNGRTMGNGVQLPLADGDELRIGEYVLRVAASAPVSGVGLGSDMAGAPAAGAFAHAGKPVDDPLALFGGSGPATADPLADLMRQAEPALSTPHPAISAQAFGGAVPTGRPASPSAPAPGVIPDDFDPFGEQFAARPLSAEPPPEARLPDDFDLGLSPKHSGAADLDGMFGLKPGERAGTDLFGPGSALGEQVSAPNTAPTADPFAAFAVAPSPPPPPVSDQVPELHGSYLPPVARPEASPLPQAEPQTELHGMVVSWDREAGSVKTTGHAPTDLPELPPLPPLAPMPPVDAPAQPVEAAAAPRG